MKTFAAPIITIKGKGEKDMLNQPTLEKLKTLKFHGMVRAWQEQLNSSDFDSLSFEERLGLLVDRELSERENRRLQTRLKTARLRQQACLEDIDYQHPRGLDKSLILSLGTCRWIDDHLNILISGPTGAGKSFIACALAHRACLEGKKALYFRASRLFSDLALTKGDGRYSKLMSSIAKTDLLVIDDWGLSTLIAQERGDLLEIMEDRHGVCSTVIAAQLPVEHWHEVIGNPTLADAILDRLVHNAYKIKLKGESMRKKKAKKNNSDSSNSSV
jgi:DNA replication protein DnaC